jgi:segregation and condensation protein B
MSEPSNGWEPERLRAVLECLLFVAREPVTPRQVAQTLALEETAAEAALEELRRGFAGSGGLQVTCVAGGYEMATRPEFAEHVAAFLRPPAQKLSRQALETLAIIAYQQPMTQPQIDALRGVNSDGVLKTLLERDLIAEVGRAETVGRPILYGTTAEFLKHFGLKDLTELPLLSEEGLQPP